MRLYKDVWEQLRGFMNEYTEFKSMDLVSMLLVTKILWMLIYYDRHS